MITSHKLFVSGIGTSVGKTIVSAILTRLLDAEYWKPIQAGDLDNTDSRQISLLSGPVRKIHPERYRLSLAASPHEAAEKDGHEIRLDDFELPVTTHSLIVEGAGGLFVPINDRHFMIDMVRALGLPVVLVARDYLGCINHTVLSLKALETAGIPLDCIVFNGVYNKASRDIILKHLPGQAQILDICELAPINAAGIHQAAIGLKYELNNQKCK